MKNTLMLAAIFIFRISATLLLFVINPVLAMLTNILLDYADGPLYRYYLKIPDLKAQYYDKLLDYFYYVVLMFFVFKINLAIWPLLFTLFVYRSIGEFIFFKTGKREVFVYFPNFFEYFTLGFLIINEVNSSLITLELNWVVFLFLVIAIFRIWNEIFLHKENKTFFQVFWLPLFESLGFKFAKKLRRGER